MKSVLVIIRQANLNSLDVHESLSATMVLATFGCEIKVLLKDAGLSLLQAELAFQPLEDAFKVASNLVDSFEFYDLSPVLVENKDKNHPFVTNSQQDLEFITLDADFIRSFDYILSW